MKALKADGITYSSSAEYVRYLLEDSPKTGLTDSDIARLAKVSPQTVYATKMKMLGLMR